MFHTYALTCYTHTHTHIHTHRYEDTNLCTIIHTHTHTHTHTYTHTHTHRHDDTYLCSEICRSVHLRPEICSPRSTLPKEPPTGETGHAHVCVCVCVFMPNDFSVTWLAGSIQVPNVDGLIPVHRQYSLKWASVCAVAVCSGACHSYDVCMHYSMGKCMCVCVCVYVCVYS